MFGLKGKLTILACSFCLIPSILISGFVYTLVVQNSVEMLKSELISEAEVKTQWLESWCNELILITEDSAQNEIFRNGSDEDIIAYLRELRDFWNAETVALVDPSGSSRLNTYNYIAKFSDGYVKQALNGSVAHGGVGVSTITNNPVFSAAAPINDGDEIIGALVLNRNIQKIADEFNQAYGYETRDSFILSPNRMVMTEGRLNDQIRMSVLDTAPAHAATDGVSGSARYRNHLDSEVIGAWEISDMGWTIVEEVETSEALASVYGRLPLLFLVVGGLITIALFSAFFFANHIVKPIRRLALSANRIAEGNLALDNKIDIRGKDEISYLAISFNAMLDNLRYLISIVKNTANNLGEQLNTIRGSSSNVADSTAKQSDIVLAVNQSVSELAESSDTIAAGALAARQSGESAFLEAQKSSSSITSAVNTLKILRTAVSKLGITSARIGEITEVIDNIADQTNLLAINASIEAARAGDQGKGFTVVAEAVGSLAEKTSSSAKEITQLVGDIREKIQEAVRVSDTGSTNAGEAIKAMEGIIHQIEIIAGKTGEIYEATKRQSIGTKDATASMEELGVASEEAAESAREMEKAAETLSAQGHKLLDLVKNFTNL